MKILLIQNTISPYRVPVYNILSEKFDLTVLYSYGDVPKDCKFSTILVPIFKFKNLIFHKSNIRKIANKFDVVLALLSPNWISINKLLFKHRKYSFIPWGIGVPASYSVKYDDSKKNLSVYLIKRMIKKSDAAIFYSDYPKQKYSNMGVDINKLFVAHNTVFVSPDIRIESNRKSTFLFVGSLYKSKGIDLLLNSYKEAFATNNTIPCLNIVGGGEDYSVIRDWIINNKLQEKVFLVGAIYDENLLKEYFEKAIICISPSQAGLSVQKSLGYGVPFITSKQSYTGGEIFDIADGINGLLFDVPSDLTRILLDAHANKEKYVKMGKNGRNFYLKERTINDMANGVIEAINYVVSKENR